MFLTGNRIGKKWKMKKFDKEEGLNKNTKNRKHSWSKLLLKLNEAGET